MNYTKQRARPWRVSGGGQQLGVRLLFLLAVGCDGSARSLPLNQNIAVQSLVSSLDAWQAGEQRSTLMNRQPPIVVGDLDWEAGQRLSAYTLLAEHNSDGTNLYIPVELTLAGDQGRELKRKVTYVVGTSPVITVIREN